jgi:hypothetical protein
MRSTQRTSPVAWQPVASLLRAQHALALLRAPRALARTLAPARAQSSMATSTVGRLAEKFYYDFSLHKRFLPNMAYNKYVAL